MHRDITERKAMEEKLRESEERFRTLFESIQDPVGIFVGREGRLIDYNKAFKKLSGYTDEELKDKVFLDFVHPDDQALVLEKYRTEYPEEELPLVYEIRAVNKTGKIIPLEISVSTYKKKGRVIGIEVIHRDITERKKMERKLQEYAEHLEEMVEERTRELKESQERLIKAERLAAIGQLATMIGHDLRNPLTSIQNACYYLKMKFGASKDEKIRKIFEVVDKEISHANNIIKDLLDFSRVKKPDLKKVDLISAIQDALAQLKFPENITCTTKFSEAPIIEADPDQLRRVLQNIALNGIQAMPDGGELIVSTRKNSDFVEVAFTDTGVGIPEENMSRLFTPLFTTKAQGVGLGLAICKNIVEAHNGKIEVESKVGEGSTFTIKLPIHQSKGGEK
jgi:PAS domain S-box-containing protein